MYRKRMNAYYPQVIQSILEFRAIIDSEYPEIERLKEESENVLSNAYLTTMNEDRINQWETILGIKPIKGSSIEDRRDTIIARIRGQGKLNTALINNIVNAFTGGTAESWVDNNTLYVAITPPPNNKTYQFDNVRQELLTKIPAHLKLEISRNYFTWEDIKNDLPTWEDVKDNLSTWNDVLLFTPFN